VSRERAYIAAMKRHGIVYPEIVLKEAGRSGIRVSLGCALLEQESAGGKNVWGNDRAPNGETSGLGWKTVTERAYKIYKSRRGSRGQGGMQGVGPPQLTWYEFQDRADRLGGCWTPENSIRVGFEVLASLIKTHGYSVGVERYNGVGRKEYSRSVRDKAEKWRGVLAEAEREGDDPKPSEPYPELEFGEKGPKVERLQRELNQRAKARDLWSIKVDREYGPESHGLAVEVVYRLGVYEKRIRGGVLSAYAHELVVRPEKRNKVQLVREKKRAKEDGPTGKAPRIVRAPFKTRAVFGGLGAETRVTTHYSGGPRARNLDEAIRLSKQHQSWHLSKGWGGDSYHFNIPDSGEILLTRPVSQKGAGVAGQNSGNVHINFYCTTGDRPTRAQIETAKWLISNAHTRAMPSSHRTDRDLRRADIRGHRSWPGQSTGCPGHFTPQNLGLRR
jgi:hypothetical protein